MSRIARSARPACSSFSASVEALGLRISSVDALGASKPRSDGDVDPGVHRVGREVEQQRGALVRAVAARSGCSPQPRERRRGRAAAERGGALAHRCSVRMGRDAPPGHLLAQPDAVAVADVPVLLQVLRVRDPPAAPARARRRSSSSSTAPSSATSRSCWCSPARRPTTTPASRATARRARPRGLHRLRRLGAASARSSAACCRTRTSASSAARTSPACARSPPRRG